MDYPLKRISYVQIQVPSTTESALIFYTVRPYRLEDGVIIDAPISEEVGYTHIVNQGEMGLPCQQFNDYLLSLTNPVEV
jgi:hypothetical protein